MDDSPIQTALCVIGHPIGGNPTQFAAQRVLAGLGLDWQFISFDVDPMWIEQAIRGMVALGFRGAMIASPYETKVGNLLVSVATEGTDKLDHSPWHDCLFQDDDQKLVVANLYSQAAELTLEDRVKSTGTPIEHCLLVGDPLTLDQRVLPLMQMLPVSKVMAQGQQWVAWPLASPLESTPDKSQLEKSQSEKSQLESSAEVVSQATTTDANKSSESSPVGLPPSLVVWVLDSKPTKKPPAKLNPLLPTTEFILEFISQLHPDSIVFDLSGTFNQWSHAAETKACPSIQVIGHIDLEILRLAIALNRWTGQEASRDTIRDAFEEYLEI
jgi:Shikimate dehydrogenase substrate binding domain